MPANSFQLDLSDLDDGAVIWITVSAWNDAGAASTKLWWGPYKIEHGQLRGLPETFHIPSSHGSYQYWRVGVELTPSES